MLFKQFLTKVLHEDAPVNSTGPAIAGINSNDIAVTQKRQAQLLRRILPVVSKTKKKQTDNIIKEEISLQYHDTLNPVLWSNDVLDSSVAKAVLNFAEQFRQFAKIPPQAVKDVVITGGNCNYNYTSQSDIDVHLVVDLNEINKDASHKWLSEFLWDKKRMWLDEHPNIKIKGYPVEPYAQDVTEKPHPGQGIYSVKTMSWIQKPVHGNYDWASSKLLQRKTDFYAKYIDKLVNNEHSQDKLNTIRSKLYAMRSAGIEKSGEFSNENLIFKDLRNKGYLDKIQNYLSQYQDRQLSLNENKEFSWNDINDILHDFRATAGNRDSHIWMPRMCDKHINHPIALIRCKVAMYGTDEHRDQLVNDKEPEVRAIVAKYGNFSHKKALWHDLDSDVRQAARS